jgi:hypothetical protein
VPLWSGFWRKKTPDARRQSEVQGGRARQTSVGMACAAERKQPLGATEDRGYLNLTKIVKLDTNGVPPRCRNPLQRVGTGSSIGGLVLDIGVRRRWMEGKEPFHVRARPELRPRSPTSRASGSPAYRYPPPMRTTHKWPPFVRLHGTGAWWVRGPVRLAWCGMRLHVSSVVCVARIGVVC